MGSWLAAVAVKAVVLIWELVRTDFLTIKASQGVHTATADAPESASPPLVPATNSAVVPNARRLSFANATKRRILEAADRCTHPAARSVRRCAGMGSVTPP